MHVRLADRRVDDILAALEAAGFEVTAVVRSRELMREALREERRLAGRRGMPRAIPRIASHLDDCCRITPRRARREAGRQPYEPPACPLRPR